MSKMSFPVAPVARAMMQTPLLRTLPLFALLLLGAGCGRKEKKPVADLVQELKASDEAVRIRAAERLGEAGADAAPDAVPALSEALGDRSSIVRAAAAKALGSFGPGARAAVGALEKARNDPDEAVRLEAAAALKKIQGG
jgi:HEAT repeat protein